MFSMNKLSGEKRIAILSALVEGSSLRSASRMVGVSINTVTKLLVDAGRACAEHQDRTLRGLSLKRVQCDEIWSFNYCKARNVADAKTAPEAAGDVWTWVALDADTKLVVTWRVGLRTAEDAFAFMDDLAARVINLTDLSTDGFSGYPAAVREAFGECVNYAQVIKRYGNAAVREDGGYSPPSCIGVTINGTYGEAKPSTSHVERQNLTMRMGMRRFTRLTNAFSKKIANLEAALALHYMHYNFVRVHKTLRTTPAIAAGVEKRTWTIGDIVELIERAESN